MINRLFFILLFFSLHTSLQAKIDEPIKKHYDLVNDPIDVIIVTHPKDKETIRIVGDLQRRKATSSCPVLEGL